jgi:uncharacterized protein (TIGR03435 family)
VARRLLGLLMNWTILMIAAFAAQSLQFEVASIKPHPRAQGRGSAVPQTLRVEPTRLNYTNASLLACIQAAYGIPGEGRPDYRIVGGPDWLTTERFDIDAKSDGPAGSEQMMQMLQTLLADRFKLKAHHETRELRAYALTTVKSEPKIARAKLDETEMFLQRRKDDPAGAAQELVVQRNTLSRFADYLARQFSQPVIDKTGLQGDYSFTLHWVPDVNPPISPLDVFGPAGSRAMEDQLGLRLEPIRANVEVLVIDHVERIPTEN